jgi:hypothetical protein
MKFETTYQLEDFILNTCWEDLPGEVQERMKGCFLDLLGALLIGSRSEQFQVGLRLAKTLYGTGDIPVPFCAGTSNGLSKCYNDRLQKSTKCQIVFPGAICYNVMVAAGCRRMSVSPT